ncbi:hypothetical protein GBAR_LOCUS28744 [Geodia barretti]|uniref:Uncharacterized protein n=1 Tax=Geodia barretti TaxID=519541 RepID=A0AA35XIX8_GEOBA|nr:hypothetical protein GBAR_LOCUS28744 [Geodia barretti]
MKLKSTPGVSPGRGFLVVPAGKVGMNQTLEKLNVRDDLPLQDQVG